MLLVTRAELYLVERASLLALVTEARKHNGTVREREREREREDVREKIMIVSEEHLNNQREMMHDLIREWCGANPT